MIHHFSSSTSIITENHLCFPGFNHAQQVDLDDGNDEGTLSRAFESDGVFHHLNPNRDLC